MRLPGSRALRPASAVGLAAAAFGLGASVYLFDRPDVLFPGPGLGWNGQAIGPIWDSLPSFAHAFAFTTWIALAVGGGPRAVLGVAISWATLESVFELAQIPDLQWALENSDSIRLAGLTYGGVFDMWDLAAIWTAGG